MCSKSTPTPLLIVAKVCSQSILLLKEFVLLHGGPLATVVAAAIGPGTVTSEVRTGRSHAFSSIGSKIDELKQDATKLGKDIKEKVQDLGAEIQDCESIITETAFHTIRALDGNRNKLGNPKLYKDTGLWS